MTGQHGKYRVLNFYPYYEKLLRQGKKDTTIRLKEDKRFVKGELVSITTGWSEDSAGELFKAKIISTKTKEIKDLTKEDLKGESPDCKSPEAVLCVISCIYKKVLYLNDKVRLIKFKRIND